MKLLLKIFLILTVVGLFFSLFEDDKANTKKNGNTFTMYEDKIIPLKKEEIAGTYKGNYIALPEYGGLELAAILEFKTNGTYSAKTFTDGNEDERSPQNGTYTIGFEKDIEIEKDPYGEVTGKSITYLHTLTCNWQSPYGLRVSRYYISNNKKNQLRLRSNHNFFRYPSFVSFISNEIKDYLIREDVSLSFTNNEEKNSTNSLDKEVSIENENNEDDFNSENQYINNEASENEENVVTENEYIDNTLENKDSNPNKYIKINDPDGYTNVRAGKSSSTEIISQIYDENKLFELIDDNGNWWEIKLDSEEDEITTGFIHNSKVLKVESFTVVVNKAYFYLKADEDYQNRAYLIQDDQLLCHSNIENNFRNCTYINSKGDTTIGYIKMNQLKRK